MCKVDDCLLHACVFCCWMCRLDVSVVPFRICLFLGDSFWLCRYGFLTFPCLWKICFSDKMISGAVSWMLGLDGVFK